jgi:nucleoside-diphosphate-sugar epimerase
MDEVEKGRLTAIIARSPDFYGPTNSVLIEMVVKNLSKNKKGMWMADVNKIHTYAAASDAAKATALLGNTSDAYNQVWHLPTSHSQLTGLQWIELIARIMKKKPKYTVIPGWMLSLMGLFVPVLGEMSEMIYQYDRNYIFDSSRFEKRFGFVPLTPEEGLTELINSLGYNKSNEQTQ